MHADESTTIFKRDVLGRVTIPKAQREALLDEFERSGLKGKPFAKLVGVNYQTFAVWIQNRRRARGDYAAAAITKTQAPAAVRSPRPLRLIEAVSASHGAALPTVYDLSVSLFAFVRCRPWWQAGLWLTLAVAH